MTFVLLLDLLIVKRPSFDSQSEYNLCKKKSPKIWFYGTTIKKTIFRKDCSVFKGAIPL